jgi:hypothetical protein
MITTRTLLFWNELFKKEASVNSVLKDNSLVILLYFLNDQWNFDCAVWEPFTMHIVTNMATGAISFLILLVTAIRFFHYVGFFCETE